jgi:hypothetical protein
LDKQNKVKGPIKMRGNSTIFTSKENRSVMDEKDIRKKKIWSNPILTKGADLSLINLTMMAYGGSSSGDACQGFWEKLKPKCW